MTESNTERLNMLHNNQHYLIASMVHVHSHNIFPVHDISVFYSIAIEI